VTLTLLFSISIDIFCALLGLIFIVMLLDSIFSYLYSVSANHIKVKFARILEAKQSPTPFSAKARGLLTDTN